MRTASAGAATRRSGAPTTTSPKNPTRRRWALRSGWLLQLDGDAHRNAFLNSPWVKAVLPIRPGREAAALNWLKQAHVEGAEDLDAAYGGTEPETGRQDHRRGGDDAGPGRQRRRKARSRAPWRRRRSSRTASIRSRAGSARPGRRSRSSTSGSKCCPPTRSSPWSTCRRRSCRCRSAMSLFEKRRTVVHGESQSLKVFLMSRLQAWRWPIMLANSGIRVERAGKPVAKLTLDYQLTAGEVVVTDEVSGTTWSALEREATASYRDYVFAPPDATDAYTVNKREVILRDPRTLAVPTTVKHLQALTESLTMLGSHPIRHLVLVSHGNVFGDIMLPMRDKQNPQDINATYMSWDSLKEAVKAGYLMIVRKHSNAVLVPRPTTSQGDPVPCGVLIRGCRAGVHQHLLAKVREAFGEGIDVVVMSKYFEAADFIGQVSPTVYAAAIEYFMHEFVVTSKTKLDCKAVIDEFKKAKFTDWLGVPVPDGDWEKLVAKDVASVAPTLEIKTTIPGRDKQGILRARFDGTPMATQTEVMTQTTTPTEQEIRDFIVKRWRTLDMFKDTEWPIGNG